MSTDDTFRVGDRVMVTSRLWREPRPATVRGFRFNEDEDASDVLVDLDPPPGRSATGASMGWVIPARNVTKAVTS